MHQDEPYDQTEDIVSLGILCAALKDLVAVTQTEQARNDVHDALNLFAKRVVDRELERADNGVDEFDWQAKAVELADELAEARGVISDLMKVPIKVSGKAMSKAMKESTDGGA